MICWNSFLSSFLGYSFEKDRFWLKDDGFGYTPCSCDKSVTKLLKKLDCSRASFDRSLSTHFPLEFTKVGWTKKLFRILLYFFWQNCDIFIICDTMFSYELCTNAFCDAFMSIKVEKFPNFFLEGHYCPKEKWYAMFEYRNRWKQLWEKTPKSVLGK